MKPDQRVIAGVLLVAALLAGCDTSTQPATPVPSPTSSVMTSQPALPSTAYPAPDGYPAPNNPATTAYPVPTSRP